MSKGLSSIKTLTAKEIAKKWDLPLSVVAKKIAAGVKVEKEHTKSTRQASEIARDHLGERPDYYEKLDKIEKEPVKEETGVGGVRGLGYVSGDPSGTDYIEKYVNTNSMSYEDENGNNLKYLEKMHRKLHDRSLGFKEFDPKKIKSNSNKDLAESLGSDYGTSAVPVIGDLTGASRKVAKVDEVKIPQKAKKAVATGMTLANLYTAGDVASRAQQGIGHPVKDIVAAASTLPGTKGWAAYGAHKARQAYEYVKGKKMQEDKDPCWKGYEMVGMKKKKGKTVPNCVPTEQKNLVPADTTERGIYETKSYYASSRPRPGWKPSKDPTPVQNTEPQKVSPAMQKAFDRIDAAFGKKKKDVKEEHLDEAERKRPIGPKEPKEVIRKKLSSFAKREYERVAHDLPKEGEGHNWAAIGHGGDAMYDKYADSYPKLKGKFTGITRKALAGYLSKDEPRQTRANEKKAERAWARKNNPPKPRAKKDPTDNRDPYNKRAGYTFHQKPRRSKFSESADVPYNHGRGKPGVGETPVASNVKGSGTYYKLARGYDGRSTHHVIYTKKGETIQSKTEKSALKKLDKLEETKKTQGYQNWPGEKKKKFFSGPKDDSGKTETQKWAERRQKEREAKKEKLDEISAELVGKISNARFRQGKAPSKTLSRAINKKFIEIQLKKEKETGVPFEGSHKRSHEKSSTHVHRLAMQGLKAQLKEETVMDTKELINEALDNILEENLVAMKENLQTALQEKVMEKLEERKKIIASDYFAQ